MAAAGTSALNSAAQTIPGGLVMTQFDVSGMNSCIEESEIDAAWADELFEGVTIDSLRKLEPATEPGESVPSPHLDRSTTSPVLAEVPQRGSGSTFSKSTAAEEFDSSTTNSRRAIGPSLDTSNSPQKFNVTTTSAGRSTRFQDREFVDSPPDIGSAKPARVDWRWPRVVDELIATQWALVNQLGRSALASSLDDVQRVSITGPRRGVGKTTIALTLARWAAMNRQRVLLVDADFGQPNLARRLGVESSSDWRDARATHRALNKLSQHLLDAGLKASSSGQTVAAAAFADNYVHCSILPISLLPLSNTPTPDSLMRNAMEQLVSLLPLAEQEFDCCFIDCGPISDLVDQIDSVYRLSSSVVIVNSMNSVLQSELILACNEVWRRGNPAITIAENKSTNVPA